MLNALLHHVQTLVSAARDTGMEGCFVVVALGIHAFMCACWEQDQ